MPFPFTFLIRTLPPRRRHPPLGWALALAVLLTWVGATNVRAAAAEPDDVATVDGLMRAYYDVVSGPGTRLRDRARDRALHHPEAQLMVPMDEGLPTERVVRMTLDQFHDWSAATYAQGFYEQEIRREVRRFGSMLHVFSQYETRRVPGGPVLGRGVNSIQLHHDGRRYWVLSETWASETPGRPLPARVPSLEGAP